MVSPALADSAGLVFGNGAPVVGAPGLTDVGQAGAAMRRVVLLPAVWQPLQVLVSPGSTCSQLVCCAVMRRAFASSDVDGERHIGRHLDLHRSVGLDRRVAEDLAHAHAGGSERRVC